MIESFFVKLILIKSNFDFFSKSNQTIYIFNIYFINMIYFINLLFLRLNEITELEFASSIKWLWTNY